MDGRNARWREMPLRFAVDRIPRAGVLKCPYIGQSKEEIVPVKITGIVPPVPTPFDENGEINEKAFRRQVKFFLDKGVHGVCVGGSTGEGHTLTSEEFRRLIEICAEEVNGKVPLVAGIIANSTREAIARARARAADHARALRLQAR
jgi:4-hydroxy-tetrahydrodipicolinate synthase